MSSSAAGYLAGSYCDGYEPDPVGAGPLPAAATWPKAHVDFSAWHYNVGDAVRAPPLPVPGHRTCCQRCANLPSCVAPLWRITAIR